MNLNKKFFVFALVLIAFDITYLYIRFNALPGVFFKEESVARSSIYIEYKDQTIKEISELIKRHIPDGSFSLGVSDKTNQTFGRFYSSIQNPSIFRAKAYDTSSKLIWSNLADIIGQVHADNEELQEALEGEIKAEIEFLKETSDNLTERSFARYAEIYIPVRESNGKVAGVIEFYMSVDNVLEAIQRDFLITSAWVFISTLAFFVSVLLVAKVLKK